MPSDPSLADLVMSFFTQDKRDNRALTLARMAHITDGIADGRFIASTPAADAIYGRKMDGSQPVWMSLTQPLELFIHMRKMWAARQLDTSIPTQYITDIVQPNGQVIHVIKTAREFDIDGVRYWFTTISQASDLPRAPHIRDISVSIDGLPVIGMAGKMCIAEVIQKLESMKKNLTGEDNTGKIDSGKNILDIVEPDKALGTNTQAITITPSYTGKSQRPHYLHHCSECRGSWVGTSVNPPKCIYCNSRLWRGFSKWEERKRREG